MKMITAIVRMSCLERTVKALEDAGIKGMTISEIKGIGEQVQLYSLYAIHTKIEIIAPDEKAEEIKGVILENAHTGLSGDGIVAVSPVDTLTSIRTREKI